MSLHDWAKFGWLKPHETDVEYDYVDGASKSEAEELLDFAKELREDVVPRLRKKYPTLGVPIEDPPGS